jgi:hypothetical protein
MTGCVSRESEIKNLVSAVERLLYSHIKVN